MIPTRLPARIFRTIFEEWPWGEMSAETQMFASRTTRGVTAAPSFRANFPNHAVHVPLDFFQGDIAVALVNSGKEVVEAFQKPLRINRYFHIGIVREIEWLQRSENPVFVNGPNRLASVAHN